MPSATRIPRGIMPFNSYINTTNTYFLAGTPTNATRLGIVAAETTAWTGFLTAWNPLFAKYMDKKNSRTTVVIEQLNALIEKTVAFDQTNHILDRIASSTSATIADLETFNIKTGLLQKTTRTIPTTPIAEPVSVTIQALGGGKINLKCYTSTSKRAGIFADADSVQIAYTIGNTPPASAEAEGLNKEISTRGILNLSLGADKAAQYLYIYFRWYSTKRPELSGPWSSLQTNLIM